ncbi:MAG: response regulator [Syntrophomonadaceae bacterium]|nr:response regulator [Syntrophomonadaceae bacterium]
MMKIAALDNEAGALNILMRSIGEALPTAEVRGFRHASELLREVRDKGFVPHVAFLDIEMPGMSGLELAKRLKDMSGATNVVFVTGFAEYALEAYSVHACGYVLKPPSAEKILETMKYLHSTENRQDSGKRVRVQCFGSFEVFVDGRPVAFPRQRSKELLAYFIDRRGATSTLAEIADRLWDDGKYGASRKSQIHNYLSALSKTLNHLGVGELLVRNHNAYGIDVRYVDCDLYRLATDITAINSYHGEYMSQYAWAEFTAGELMLKYL